jgi:Uma2 family endonuclease
MIQAIPKHVTFDEFIAWYPENSENRYELHNGVIVEMPKPTGKHSEVAGFLNIEIGVTCRYDESLVWLGFVTSTQPTVSLRKKTNVNLLPQ